MNQKLKYYLGVLLEVAEDNDIPKLQITKGTLREMLKDSDELEKVSESHEALVEANNHLLEDITNLRTTLSLVEGKRDHLLHSEIPYLHKQIADLTIELKTREV